jgi:hypothetical protein
LLRPDAHHRTSVDRSVTPCATTKMRCRMSFSALLVLPGEPANPVILRRCYSGDMPDLHKFTILASARQSTDGHT